MPKRKQENSCGVLGDGVVVAKSEDGLETFTLFYGGTPCFSNFFPARFSIANVDFVNSEQYFHYKKAELFNSEDMMHQILLTENPREHKKLGRLVEGYDENVWNASCAKFMKEGLKAKFTQNADLGTSLLDTVGTVLVEASPRDRKWGIGLGKSNVLALNRKNWRGSNLLGKLLMEVRDEILLERRGKGETNSKRGRVSDD